MQFCISRRKMLQGAGAAAVAQSVEFANAAPPARQWPIEEGPETPKICLGLGDGGGPLPARLQPQNQGPAGSGAAGGPPAAGAGAARATNRGSGFGGTLTPRPETAQTAAASGWTRRRRQSCCLSAHQPTRRDALDRRERWRFPMAGRECSQRHSDRQGPRHGRVQRDDRHPEHHPLWP